MVVLIIVAAVTPVALWLPQRPIRIALTLADVVVIVVLFTMLILSFAGLTLNSVSQGRTALPARLMRSRSTCVTCSSITWRIWPGSIPMVDPIGCGGDDHYVIGEHEHDDLLMHLPD